MRFPSRVPTLLSVLAAAARDWRATFWGAGATTVRTTPWHLQTLPPVGARTTDR